VQLQIFLGFCVSYPICPPQKENQSRGSSFGVLWCIKATFTQRPLRLFRTLLLHWLLLQRGPVKHTSNFQLGLRFAVNGKKFKYPKT
jgi:hypothetical protein